MAQHQQHITINDDDDDDDDGDKWCDDVIKTDTAGQKLDIFTFAVRSQNGGRFYYEHSKNAAYGNGVTDQYIDLSAAIGMLCDTLLCLTRIPYPSGQA